MEKPFKILTEEGCCNLSFIDILSMEVTPSNTTSISYVFSSVWNLRLTVKALTWLLIIL